MKSVSKSLRRLALCCAYALGVFFVVASGGGSGGGGGTTPDTSCRLEVSAIAPATDGSDDVWIGVYSITSQQKVNSVARLDSAGVEQIWVEVGDGRSNVIRTVAIATDGSDDVYVGGDFDEGIFRLDEDGDLDTGFDVGSGFNGSVTRILPLADASGDIYVVGYFDEYKGLPVSGIVKLTSDGTDTGFAAITRSVEDVVYAGGSFTAAGFIYTGGFDSIGDAASRLVRWTGVGTKDPVLDFTTNIGPVFSVVPALDGTDSLYAGGGIPNGIIRLSQFGTPEGSFNVGSGGFNADVQQILRADDLSVDIDLSGDIYVVGGFTTYDGNSANGIERLNADGSTDAGFVTGTGFTIPDGTAPFAESASVALALVPADTIYVGGNFLLYNGTASNGIARLDKDGSLDLGFAVEISSTQVDCTNETIPGLD